MPANNRPTDPAAPGLPPRIDVPAAAAGMRMDTWLSRLPGAPSRNRVQQLVKDGHVRIGGNAPRPSHTLTGGELIEVDWPAAEDDWPWPQEIPLDIVYTDEEVAVINKQPGLVVHPSPGHPDGTLVNALLHRFPGLPGINGIRRPGIVHRLDRDTTGLLVVAKTERAMSSLARQLEKRAVRRQYLGMVLGSPDWEETTVDAPVGRDPVNRLKRAIDGPFARQARSHFRLLARTHQFALIGARLDTGRTHQIRIHCKHLGHPIVCDDTYDGQARRCVERLANTQWDLKRALQHFGRPWLHAHNLQFHHPGMDKLVRFRVPPPEDSAALAELVFGEEVRGIFGERQVEGV